MYAPASSPLSDDRFAAVRRFYTHTLGCQITESRHEEQLALDFFGHHLILQCTGEENADSPSVSLTIPSDGLILEVDQWCEVADRLRAHGVDVSIAVPSRLGAGAGQQCLMSLRDPLGNVIEVRGFRLSATTLAA